LREEAVTAVAGRAFWGRSLILLHGLLINMARARWPYIGEASHRGFTITPPGWTTCELGNIVICNSGAGGAKRTTGRLCKLCSGRSQLLLSNSACLHCL